MHSERDLPSIVNASIELEVGEHPLGQRAYPPVADPPLGASIMASIAGSMDEGDAPERALDAPRDPRPGRPSPQRGDARRDVLPGIAEAEEPSMELHGGEGAGKAEDEARLAQVRTAHLHMSLPAALRRCARL